MKRFFSSTRGRLVVSSVIILAAALTMADLAALGTLWAASDKESDSVLSTQANAIVPEIKSEDGVLSLNVSELRREGEGGVAVQAALVKPSGQVIGTPEQPLPDASLLKLTADANREGKPIWADVVDNKGITRRAYVVPLTGEAPSAALVVTRSVSEMQSSFHRTTLFLIVLSGLVLVIGGFLANWLAGRALKPVTRIAGLARSLSEHDLNRRVEVKVPADELGELVETFNSMLARLEAAFDSLRNFTADAAHELRAPLALMRAELEGSLRRQRTAEEYKRVQETVYSDVKRLSRLADQLLMLTRADAGALEPAVEPIDVADFLHEVAAVWRPAAEDRGVHISADAPDSGSVIADPVLMRRVLDNLVDNAIRYSPASTAVSLSAHRSGEGWNFEVADQGPGVPAAYQDRLFTRFARPDPARNRNADGAGLGLALSAAIARAHEGTLRLVGAGGPGATFQLHVPTSYLPPEQLSHHKALISYPRRGPSSNRVAERRGG
jgi:two-component system heavy metal sensor histidine kinase CusS